MAQKPIQPLSEDRYRDIVGAEGMIIQAQDLMDRAEKCGVDVTEDRIVFEAFKENFAQWKANFFPTRR